MDNGCPAPAGPDAGAPTRTTHVPDMHQILNNPTLHPAALTAEERLPKHVKWHLWAHSPRSSQVFCFSAFGALRRLAQRHDVLDRFVTEALPTHRPQAGAPKWDIHMEHEDPELLNEAGSRNVQPTSVDALLVSSGAVIAVEAKFAADAAKGFGRCSKFSKGDCAGFYGPGSDLKRSTGAWCQLETWDGDRSPRTYWAIAREYFRPEVFRMQTESQQCPLRDANYQLMRNFLFVAAYARRWKLAAHGVITIAPDAVSSRSSEQVNEFRSRILLPEHAVSIAHTTYENYTALLRQSGGPAGVALANFLEERIDTVVNSSLPTSNSS